MRELKGKNVKLLIDDFGGDPELSAHIRNITAFRLIILEKLDFLAIYTHNLA